MHTVYKVFKSNSINQRNATFRQNPKEFFWFTCLGWATKINNFLVNFLAISGDSKHFSNKLTPKFFSPHQILFVMFHNPMITPSWRKVTQAEGERKKRR